MYDRLPGLVLGYHACDRSIGEAVIAGKIDLRASENTYDWLGHGIYFWEYNSRRATQYAHLLHNNPRSGRSPVKDPMVIGAVIDLGVCLNLLDAKFLEELPLAYDDLRAFYRSAGKSMPKNRKLRGSRDFLLRYLDCAVIETVHQIRLYADKPAFDSARGVFVEGDELYPGAAIQKLNHIQICVRNPACIKGYFRLREGV
jgi:hypothetical protein